MAEVQVKLRSVLNNILNDGFKITDRQRRIFFKNVEDEVSITERLTPSTHIYLKWIEETILLWELEGPTKEPLIFFIDLLIELSKNKIIFVLLHQNNTNKRIIKIIESTEDCDIIRSYIKLLDALTQTKFGKNWLCGTLDSWKTVFKVIDSQEYTDSLTVFLKDLFLSVVDDSELFSIDLFNEVLQPLITVSSRISGNDLNDVLEDELSLQLTPTINLLTSILTSITETITIDSQWLNHCNNFPKFKKPLIILLEIIEKEEFTLTVSKLLISLHFLEIKQFSQKTPEFVTTFTENIIKILDVNICREFLDNITVLSFQLRFFWYHICRLLEVQKLDLQYDFGVSLVLFETAPFSGICITLLGDKLMSTVEADDIREDFIVKWLKKIDRSMYFYMYKLRDIIINDRVGFTTEAHKALTHFKDSIHLYDDDTGKPFMFYIWQFFLADMIVDILKTKTVSSKHYDSDLVTHIIETLIFLGEKCEITWKDVVSPILTMGIITDLLQLQNLPNNIVIATLKTLNLVIVKDMAPDLSVSMDCSTVNSIGPLLEGKFKSENVEVRCAASKVLVTMAERAQVNYPCFRKILLDNKLPQQLFDRIFTNEATELRINALKCLRNLVKIDSVWEQISSRNLLDKIIDSLKTQTQNQVRSETVSLVATIYEEDYFSYHQVNELYDIVTRLGVHDFDVEVRMNTLKFWKIVIKKLLLEEGMIDGGFPQVTFSKETRKIVVLDEEEIKKRLRRFMGELSRNGCLTVLNSCLSSSEKPEKDCADEIISNLLDILKKYHIDTDNVMSTTLRLQKLILSELDVPILTPEEFLKNVYVLKTNDDEDSMEIFVRVLDEILKQNKV